MEKRRQGDGNIAYKRQVETVRYKVGKRGYLEKRTLYFEPSYGMIIPQNEIVPAARKLISGESFAFGSERGQGGWRELESENSPFVPILNTMVNVNETESEKACAMFTADLRRFSPNKSLLKEQDLLREWFFKLTLGVVAHPYITLRLHQDPNLAKSELVKYHKATEDQISVLRQTLASLDVDDLSFYIRLEDMLLFYEVGDLFNAGFGGNDPVLKDSALLANVAENEEFFRDSLLDEDSNTWNRLRVGWKEKQIQEVMSLLPSVRSPYVMEHAVCALQDNLFDFFIEFTKLGETEELKIDPSGMVALLKWKGEHVYGHGDSDFTMQYPHVVLESEKNLEFTNFSVPKKYLPHTAISLLIEAAKRNNKEELTNLIKNVQELAILEKVNVPWFIALTALRGLHPEILEIVEKAVNEFDTLNPQFRDIFLNRTPGKLWLTKEGKLRSTDSKTVLLSTFPIHISSKEENENIVMPQKHEDKITAPEEPEVQIFKVEETAHVPFFKEIGKPRDDDVKTLIDLIFNGQVDLDDDKLLNDFEQLSENWQLRDESIKSRNLLFV